MPAERSVRLLDSAFDVARNLRNQEALRTRKTGMLKRVIRYEVASNKTEVAIGPVNEIAGRIWNLHEFGGTATKRRKLKPHRFKVGEHGPIRVKHQGIKTSFARIRLQTSAQANRATRLVEEENERRGDNKPRHYPKRPFMKPALDTNRSRLPSFWQTQSSNPFDKRNHPQCQKSN